MGLTAGKTDADGGETKPNETGREPELSRSVAGAGDADATPARSKRGIVLILAGLVVTGIAAGYNWWKDLPK
jgi:hypothetical protein